MSNVGGSTNRRAWYERQAKDHGWTWTFDIDPEGVAKCVLVADRKCKVTTTSGVNTGASRCDTALAIAVERMLDLWYGPGSASALAGRSRPVVGDWTGM